MKKTSEIKILLLAGQGKSSKIVHNFLEKDFPEIEVVVEQPPNRWKMLKNRAKKLGWSAVVGQLIFQVVVVRLLDFFSKKRQREIFEKYQLDDSPIPTERLTTVSSVNSPEAIEIIRRSAADVILVNGTRIISKKVLAATSTKFVNTHLGITPLFRGVHGGYWTLASKNSENFGATVHLVDAGVDTGGILKQVFCQPTAADNFSTYPLVQLAETLPQLKIALVEVANGSFSEVFPPSGESRQWFHPTVFQYFKNYFLLGVR